MISSFKKCSRVSEPSCSTSCPYGILCLLHHINFVEKRKPSQRRASIHTHLLRNSLPSSSIHHHHRQILGTNTTTMETDRIETNLGATADQEVPLEPHSEVKQPKRRFVGRRTAQQIKQNGTNPNTEDVESTSIIQGELTDG